MTQRERAIGGFDAAQESDLGEIPPIHGRYGTSHFSDIFGYGSQSWDSYRAGTGDAFRVRGSRLYGLDLLQDCATANT